MKKGLILYVTEGKEQVDDWPDLEEQRALLGADAICMALSEAEVAYGWWRLLSRGMQHICCRTASYDALRAAFEPSGAPLRLCG
jgi:hypothetical protein